MSRYPFLANSNKFIINSAERKFTYLPAEHISDLVSNQGLLLTLTWFIIQCMHFCVRRHNNILRVHNLLSFNVLYPSVR